MFVKVCCIADLDEARLAIAAGASAIGLVSAMPSGPGPIAEDEIAAIAAAVPRPTETFLLTALVRGGSHRRSAAPLRHDGRAARRPRRRAGAAAPAQAPAGHAPRAGDPRHRSRSRWTRHGPPRRSSTRCCSIPAIPRLAVKELGGTGRVHDWEHSRRIRETVGVPVLLAGGLHPGNARAALRAGRARRARRLQRTEAQWAPGRRPAPRFLRRPSLKPHGEFP